MFLDILLIILGSTTTIILGFASYKAERKLIRYLFWLSLFVTVGIVIYSGISGIRLNRKMEGLKAQVELYKPFQITDADKVTLNSEIQRLIDSEKSTGKKVPKLHFLTFPGQSADAAEFQEILKKAIESNGRKVYPHHNLGVTGIKLDGEPWDGVIVEVNDLDNPPLLGQGIYSILTKLNIKTWSKEGSGYGDNDILIYSHKPKYNLEN